MLLLSLVFGAHQLDFIEKERVVKRWLIRPISTPVTQSVAATPTVKFHQRLYALPCGPALPAPERPQGPH